MRWLALTCAIACACTSSQSGVAIDHVDPGFGPSSMDVPVNIVGTFHQQLASSLDGEDDTTVIGTLAVTVGGVPLGDAVWRDESTIAGTVPAGLPSGPADVIVTLGDRSDILAGGYIVDGTNVTGDTRMLVVDGTKVTGGPHADFPMLISLTDPWLKTAANGGTVAHPMGFDIRFTADAAGTTLLSHEIERYDGTAGTLLAWVKVPSLDASTVLYIHAGDDTITTTQENPPAVWSANYVGVWHMTDASDAARGNSGSADGTSSTAGQIDGARIFNGTTDVITVSPSASIDNVFQGGGTAEAWLFLTDWGEGGFGRVFDRGPSNMVLSTCQGNGGRQGLLFGRTFAQNVGNWCTLDGTLALDAWFYVAVVYDDSTQMNRPTMYINGQQESFANVGNPTGSRLDDSATLAIGNRIGGDRAFAGQLDELRLSHTSRSAEWIATSFADQSDPASFCTFAP